MTMTIIAILAGLVLGGVSVMGRKSAEAKTRSAMAQIEIALAQYQKEYGYFPLVPAVSGKAQPLTKTVVQSLHPKEQPGKYYLDFRSLQFVNDLCVDGFRRPILYCCPGLHNTSSYDLQSLGAKEEDGGDDITNWSRN